MKEVTQKEFYSVIGPLDVCLTIIGNYPYTTEFRMRHSGTLKGKAVDTRSEDRPGFTDTKYYLPAN